MIPSLLRYRIYTPLLLAVAVLLLFLINDDKFTLMNRKSVKIKTDSNQVLAEQRVVGFEELRNHPNFSRDEVVTKFKQDFESGFDPFKICELSKESEDSELFRGYNSKICRSAITAIMEHEKKMDKEALYAYSFSEGTLSRILSRPLITFEGINNGDYTFRFGDLVYDFGNVTHIASRDWYYFNPFTWSMTHFDGSTTELLSGEVNPEGPGSTKFSNLKWWTASIKDFSGKIIYRY